jgi:hypothetical protein
MKQVEIKSKEIPVEDLKKKTALETDTQNVISKPCVVTQDGKPIIIYGRFEEDLTRLSWAVRSVKYSVSTRVSGLKSYSAIFGFSPRSPLVMHNFCSVANMAYTQPEQHKELCDFGKNLAGIYENLAPDVFAKQKEELQKIKPCWVIPETPFTSGIVNKNNPLKYHFDAGNFKGVMSCMVVLRSNCEGGYLSVPELDTRFLLENKTYFLFDGQSLLHGVTPIKLLNQNSYRYSVVYYSLKAMGKCGTFDEELAHARSSRMDLERRRSVKTEA